MLPEKNQNADSRFSFLYDKYSPAMFDLLLWLMSTKAQAEAVLIEVFEKIHRDNLHSIDANSTAASLLRLTVITAYKRQFEPTDFLEKINSLPRLHRLLLGNINLQTFVNDLSLRPGDYGREISGELKQFINNTSPQVVQLQRQTLPAQRFVTELLEY